MKILMLSDLHIDTDIDFNFAENILEKMALVVNHCIDINEEIYAIILGDIINQGNRDSERKYQIAEQIFLKLKNKIKSENLKMCFIPGNHDLCDKQLTQFNLFVNKFSYTPIDFESTTFYQEEIFGLNFVFANSVIHRERNNGKISITEIKTLHPDILCLHHSIFAKYDWTSFTYDANEILDFKCQFILHGHTHGALFEQSNSTKIISVGSLLMNYCKPEYANINNQFNLIEINNRIISTISNYRYWGESKVFKPTILYTLESNNNINESLNKTLPNNSVYIERVLIHCYESDENENIFSNSKLSLLNALKQDSLLLLIGEAGIGKSYE